MDVPAQVENQFSFPLPLSQFRSSMNWMILSHTGKDGYLLSLLIQILICSRNALPDTPRNDVLPAIWASLSTGKVTNEVDHPKRVGHRSVPGRQVSPGGHKEQ